MAHKEDYPIDQVPFPEGYEHFAGLAEFAALQLRELDARIKAIPDQDIKTIRSKYQLHPGLYAKTAAKWRNHDDRDVLERQKSEIEKELLQKIDRDIKTWEIDETTASQIRLAAIDKIHPNPFAGMSSQELTRHKSAIKDEYHSESYLRSLLRAAQQKAK